MLHSVGTPTGWWRSAMAYALRGCGVVLKSDIDKRNKAFAQSGRTPGQPVVASLFIHSVVQPATPAERMRVLGRLL